MKLRKILTYTVVFVLFAPLIHFVINMATVSYAMDQDIQALNEKRKIEFNRITPVLLEYKTAYGHSPQNLSELVPDFIDAIPDALERQQDRTLDIEYSVIEGEVIFHFRTTHGHDGNANYNASTSTYWYEP